VRTVSEGGSATRSARIRWNGDKFDLFVRGPIDFFGHHADDASSFIAMALLTSMARGEDLEVDALASRCLMGRLKTIIAAYSTWNPTLRPPEVRVRGFTSETSGGPGVASFFSRGVDSLFSAAIDRGHAEALTHLLFCDGLEPRHSRAVADEEIRRAAAAAKLLELPLVTVSTNVRIFTQAACGWGDAHGGALAGIALSLGGAFRRIVVPSSETFVTLGPYGSSPLLEPLFSSETVEVVHDDVSLTRAGKVACLATQRPDLLKYLKVCFTEDRADNCGRC